MKKTGTITTAVGLLMLGMVLIMAKIYPGEWLDHPLKWWPVLLIGLGLEIIFRRFANKDQDMKIDPLIIVFLVGIFLANIYSQARVEIMESGAFGWKYHLHKCYEKQDPLKGIKSIEIEAEDGELSLLPAEDGLMKAHTDLKLNTNRKITLPEEVIAAEREGEILVITVGCERPSNSSLQSMKTKVYLPPAIPVRVCAGDKLEVSNISNPLVIDNDEGNIDISNLNAALNIRSDNGEVKVDHIKGNVQITNEGPVTVNDISSDLRLVLTDGEVKLNEVYGNIDVSADTGTIHLNNTRGIAKDCRIRTEEGSIDLSVGRLDDIRFTASTSGGLNLPSYLNTDPKGPSTGESEGNRTVQTAIGKGVKVVELLSDLGSITVR